MDYSGSGTVDLLRRWGADLSHGRMLVQVRVGGAVRVAQRRNVTPPLPLVQRVTLTSGPSSYPFTYFPSRIRNVSRQIPVEAK